MPDKKIFVIDVKTDYRQGWDDAINDILEHRPERYTTPIPLDKIINNIFVVPCWIEIRNQNSAETEFIPDVLDKDSIGYFGKLDSLKRKKTRYFPVKDYNRIWRCWQTWVSTDRSHEVKWRDEE